MQGLISLHEHEKAKQAYYNKWILGKVYTSARHIAHSGSTLELVQNLLKESNAMVHAYQQVPEEVRKRWRANYDSRMAQQQPKQQVEKPKSWWDRYLGYTGSSLMIKSQIAMEQAHASEKAANSLVELYNGIEQANNVRYQNAGNSIGEFLDYWSFGIPKGLYQAYMERARNQGNSGSDAINFATFGITEAIRGAVTPEDPLSPDHLSNIISVAGFLEGVGSFLKPKTILNSPVKEPVHPGPKIINEKTEPPQPSNPKPNKNTGIEGTQKPTQAKANFTSEEISHLQKHVIDEAQMLKDSGLTNKQLGPAVAGAYDNTTGKFYTAINDVDGFVPKELHPIIEARIKDMPKDVYDSYSQFTHGAGSHAEVYAANKALLANPNASIDNLIIYVIKPGSATKPVTNVPFPTCPHCNYILKGFNIISDSNKK